MQDRMMIGQGLGYPAGGRFAVVDLMCFSHGRQCFPSKVFEPLKIFLLGGNYNYTFRSMLEEIWRTSTE